MERLTKHLFNLKPRMTKKAWLETKIDQDTRKLN